MRDLLDPAVDRYRRRSADVIQAYGSLGGATEGAFDVSNPWQPGEKLKVIASSGNGWDHVSVSLPTRTPSWREMEFIKRLFFKPDETAMQLHVRPEDHINLVASCLHIWRPIDVEIPLPPKVFV
jgi:hypothetical protein